MTINRKYLKISLVIIFLFGMFIIHAQTKTQWAIWQEREGEGEADTSFYKKDFKDKYAVAYNFSSIWTHTPNLNVHGFIGSDYQRLRIKYTSVVKDSIYPNIYHVKGKTMVKNTICNFQGELVIVSIKCYKLYPKAAFYNKNTPILKNGVVFGTYCFREDSTQSNSGTFKGDFASCWIINKKGHLIYDDITLSGSDFDCNNQFAGTWQGYHSNTKETCNWGDYRIPFSGDLDVGEGEFVPNTKYLKYGWESYKSGFETDKELNKAVKDAEKWWKT